MATTSAPSLSEQIAATQAWWRDAGVDCDFAGEPLHWLVREEPQRPEATPATPRTTPEPTAAPEPRVLRDASSMPQHLDAFAGWWMSETTLDTGGLSPRVAPRGPGGAELMIVVPEPEQGDRDLLLSGPLGGLLSAMLEAMKLSSEKVYLAAALPRHTPLADWPAIGRSGLGEVLRHHVRLAAPRRVLLLGQALPSLLGHDRPQNNANFSHIEHEGGATPALAARDLASLLNRPRWRAEFWRRWLDWTGGSLVG